MHQSECGRVTETASVETVPSLDRIAPTYDRLLALASELCSGPVTTRIRTWEDGEFEVRVWHKYESPEPESYRKEVLRAHSREADVSAAVVEIDERTGEERLLLTTTVNPDGISADAEKIRDRVGDD
jgi:hypothetical protein